MPPVPKTAPPRPGDTYVQSFARGLQVVRSFSTQAPEQTLSEVAERAGLTRAGARRILLTLQTLGYVESDGKWFRLTPRILELGFAYLSSMPIWDLAEPVVKDLVDKVSESSSIAVLDGSDIVYVMRVPTHKIMKISLGIGSRLPAFCTSLGRVLLAQLDDGEIVQRLAESPRSALTRHTITDTAVLLKRIQQVRRQGWSVVDQELEEGLISVAAPIHGSDGRATAAINLSGQANRTNARAVQEQLLPPLLEAAQAITHLLQRKSRTAR
ncbi:IclR family transcriptional regulator C-terminal domain-containing protein [Hydrogenophaga sp.]|uniref:IclR family transcriptional regulator domain-containing protein n=1 Tax=Hydrogenophaga sp. TaxID=1904254 RepID=UPI0027212294|nr:IclR family transcriptional regulator C-terminal domain-containing protein [Hydrogenophaga sp.]MDO9438079.1 IclR family transcriptional regulator C-terminal domain-containing protein [Hydrogenophaga sp.]